MNFIRIYWRFMARFTPAGRILKEGEMVYCEDQSDGNLGFIWGVGLLRWTWGKWVLIEKEYYPY